MRFWTAQVTSTVCELLGNFRDSRCLPIVRLWFELQGTRMFWLVNADLTGARKSQRSKSSPTLFAHLRDLDILRFQIFQGRCEVIADKVKLVLVVPIRIMERHFQRRHGEDQPALAGINRGKLKHVAEEGAVGFWILAVDNDMRCGDQGGLRFPKSGLAVCLLKR